MCLILIASNAHPHYRLIIAANRDEWRTRPTAALHYWRTDPKILAGRDLQAGGTWLGIAGNGRIAAVTNLRCGSTTFDKPRSRGQLVSEFLRQNTATESYIAAIDRQREDFNGFNLLVGDQTGLWRYCSADSSTTQLGDGIHCISNGLPSEQWPKTERSQQLLAQALKSEPPSPSSLLKLLQDSWQPPDEKLPQTGVNLELERQLAPIFVQGGDYGTRSSSLLVIEHNGRWQFLERNFDRNTSADREFQGRIDACQMPT